MCLDTRGAGFGEPIGVGGCHHWGGSQVSGLFFLRFANNIYVEFNVLENYV